MYKNFVSAITWNSINVFMYKVILLLHQIVLYYFISHELYGVSGTLFAALYLLIGCTNFGFEYSLFTFFAYYTKNRHNFKYLLYQCALKVMSTLIVAGIVYIGMQITVDSSQTGSLFLYKLPIKLIPYLLAIFIAESIRKYLETIAQLAFLNKKITLIQISMISSYVILVWTGYWIYGTISLQTIFIPMIITSCTEVLLTIASLYSWYETLPHTSNIDDTSSLCSLNIAREQFYNYINQLSKNLFSPNFLMVLIAYHVSMQQTGSIRFFTNIITLLYMLLNRSIAIPSGALFSSVTQETFAKTKQFFLIITNAYIQFLYALAIIITTTITTHLIMTYQSAEPQVINLVLLFTLAGFIEYITITYEKLYIVQHKTHQLALINASSAFIFLSIMYTLPLSASLFLLPMCIIRMVTAYLIGLYAYAQWDIRPQLQISFKAFFYGLTASLALNLIVIIRNL